MVCLNSNLNSWKRLRSKYKRWCVDWLYSLGSNYGTTLGSVLLVITEENVISEIGSDSDRAYHVHFVIAPLEKKNKTRIYFSHPDMG